MFLCTKILGKVLLNYFTNMRGNAVRLDSNAAIKKHSGRWKCLIMACFIVYFMERKAIFPKMYLTIKLSNQISKL